MLSWPAQQAVHASSRISSMLKQVSFGKNILAMGNDMVLGVITQSYHLTNSYQIYIVVGKENLFSMNDLDVKFGTFTDKQYPLN